MSIEIFVLFCLWAIIACVLCGITGYLKGVIAGRDEERGWQLKEWAESPVKPFPPDTFEQYSVSDARPIKAVFMNENP